MKIQFTPKERIEIPQSLVQRPKPVLEAEVTANSLKELFKTMAEFGGMVMSNGQEKVTDNFEQIEQAQNNLLENQGYDKWLSAFRQQTIEKLNFSEGSQSNITPFVKKTSQTSSKK